MTNLPETPDSAHEPRGRATNRPIANLAITRDIACHIANADYFHTLTSSAIDDLAIASSAVGYSRGQQVFARGDPSDAVFLVTEGEIEISVMAENGRTLNVAHVRPGEVFGEFGTIDGGARTADAWALVDSTLIRMKAAAFLRAVTGNPALSHQVMVDVIAKLRMTNIQIEELTFRPLRARIARLLLFLCTDGSAPSIRITQTQLAARLSASREKVNVHLQRLQQDGAIGLRRGMIDVRNIDVLSDFAEETSGP